MRYVYVAALSPGTKSLVLVAEPEVFGGERLVLFADGNVCRIASGEVARLLTAGGTP